MKSSRSGGYKTCGVVGGGHDDFHAGMFNVCFTSLQPQYEMLIVLRKCNVGPSKLYRTRPVDNPYPWMIVITGGSCYRLVAENPRWANNTEKVDESYLKE